MAQTTRLKLKLIALIGIFAFIVSMLFAVADLYLNHGVSLLQDSLASILLPLVIVAAAAFRYRLRLTRN